MITRSAAKDGPLQWCSAASVGSNEKLRDLAKARHLAQPEAHLVPTDVVLVRQIGPE